MYNKERKRLLEAVTQMDKRDLFTNSEAPSSLILLP